MPERNGGEEPAGHRHGVQLPLRRQVRRRPVGQPRPGCERDVEPAKRRRQRVAGRLAHRLLARPQPQQRAPARIVGHRRERRLLGGDMNLRATPATFTLRSPCSMSTPMRGRSAMPNSATSRVCDTLKSSVRVHRRERPPARAALDHDARRARRRAVRRAACAAWRARRRSGRAARRGVNRAARAASAGASSAARARLRCAGRCRAARATR